MAWPEDIEVKSERSFLDEYSDMKNRVLNNANLNCSDGSNEDSKYKVMLDVRKKRFNHKTHKKNRNLDGDVKRKSNIWEKD